MKVKKIKTLLEARRILARGGKLYCEADQSSNKCILILSFTGGNIFALSNQIKTARATGRPFLSFEMYYVIDKSLMDSLMQDNIFFSNYEVGNETIFQKLDKAGVLMNPLYGLRSGNQNLFRALSQPTSTRLPNCGSKDILDTLRAEYGESTPIMRFAMKDDWTCFKHQDFVFDNADGQLIDTKKFIVQMSGNYIIGLKPKDSDDFDEYAYTEDDMTVTRMKLLCGYWTEVTVKDDGYDIGAMPNGKALPDTEMNTYLWNGKNNDESKFIEFINDVTKRFNISTHQSKRRAVRPVITKTVFRGRS